MAQRAPADVVIFRQPATTADLNEALDAVDFLNEALIQSVGDGLQTGLQRSAMAVVQRLRRKHNRVPVAARGRPRSA